jgi:regulation of enolase protein 1 (concanavalin A-like superfamily)
MSLRSLVGQTFLSVSFCFILLPSSFSLTFAGTVRTLDGKTYDGEVKLDTGGQIVVTPPIGGKPQKIDLSEVLQATFGAAAAGAGGDATARPQAPARTENGQLPAPWHALDVGKLAEPGYARFVNEGQVFSIKSTGGNLGADEDAFCFVAQPISGDIELVTHVMTVSDARHVTQGLMIRSGPGPGATYLAIVYVAGDVRVFKRTRTGQATDAGTVGAIRSPLPVWMRLVRRGDTITAAWSRDAIAWEEIGSESLPMRAAGALAGIAVCGSAPQRQGGHVTGVRLTALAPVVPASAAAPPAAAARSLKEGLMFRSGTLLAGAQIEQADDGSVRFVKGDRRDTLSLASVARIIFRELSPAMVAKIPDKRTGVLLREGDFVEGAFKGLQQGRVQLSSILFGLARFDTRDKALAVILNDLEPSRPQMILRTRDGSIYMARSVAPEKDKLIIEDAVAGQFTINRWEVTEISAGAGRLEPLTTLKPEKIDPTPSADDAGAAALSIDSTGLGLPMTLAGVPCEHGFALTAGSAATWNLAGKYRTFTFKCGVPPGVLPTAPNRFIVLADGKELYKSRPQTGLDEPLSASLSTKGITTLTLKVESTTANPFPTPGLWADPALVK